MPAMVCWAVNKIGVDAAFEDCDANRDGIITIKEMHDTDTYLTSCTKLADQHGTINQRRSEKCQTTR